jgi:cell division inhibitor SepF
MLHRLGSAIGLYPEDRAQDDYDDYDEPFADNGFDQDEPFRGAGRSNGYSTRSSGSGGSPPRKGAPRTVYGASGGSGYGAPGSSGSAGSYDSAASRRSPIDNVVQMPARGNAGSAARDASYGSQAGGSASASGYAGGASSSPSRHSEIIVYVRRKDDAQQIIGYVLEERSVILNCESIDDAQCQRVIDMLGGAAYAIGGHVQRVSHRNYLFAPPNVEVSSSDSQPVSRYQAVAAQS